MSSSVIVSETNWDPFHRGTVSSKTPSNFEPTALGRAAAPQLPALATYASRGVPGTSGGVLGQRNVLICGAAPTAAEAQIV
jgi:hypothetical protein